MYNIWLKIYYKPYNNNKAGFLRLAKRPVGLNYQPSDFRETL